MAIDTTRVSTWDGYIGQEPLKARLRVHIDAAIEQMRPLEHVLLAAGPGYGKTALARIIATEMNGRFEPVQMPCTEAGLSRIIMECDSYGDYCVLFLDEIHSASRKEQEFLQPFLEFGFISDRRGRRYEATNFTVIGATTEANRLVRPLYDRFSLNPDWDNYTVEEIARIMVGMATMLELTLDEETAMSLAQASGGTPRHARDFMLAARALRVKLLRPPTAEEVLDLCRVDEDGLSHAHYEYLRTLYMLGPVTGLANIRNVLRLPEAVVRDLEMLLLQHDLIALTSSGREMLPAGMRKIKVRRREPST